MQRKSKKEKKEKKDKQTKEGVVDLRTIEDRTIIKIPKKHVKVKFTIAWTPTIVKEVDDNFH